MNINRAVDTIASEMLELLPSVLSRREIGEPGHDVRPSPVVTAAVGTDPVVGGAAVQLTARVFEEEEPARHSMEWSSGPWFCARLVVVNSAARGTSRIARAGELDVRRERLWLHLNYQAVHNPQTSPPGEPHCADDTTLV